ncbi:alkanesulfonate transporter substrate-binding subunit [Hartmannibacter diazotrophicus]|uniref:Alkanesulfonate transporter substrate-binding subunit n=1 Tax=Hartmannibacter diazotrophicus TaxID=1482074 RepID=A0A2C9D929_9HYPH|nr:ABC transporter substrate-binding protein [Hartmannibacter diazotrophicus]SON56689.1 alkanesulfonate transporter substrate-binding subunit [Hartmannibacter diazotrophicus]
MATRRDVLKGAAAATALGLGATRIARAADGPLKIRMGWANMPGHLIPVLYLNPDQYGLKHYGKSYTVEPIRFRGSSPQIAALASKEIDFAAFGALVVSLSVTNARLDTKAVADIIEDGLPNSHSETFCVKADGPIKTVEDLKGKRIATNALGSASDTAIRAMLDKSGLDPKRDGITFVEASFPNIPSMIEEGKVDLGTVIQPFSQQGIDAGKLKTLFTSKDAIGPSQLVTLCSTGPYLDANRDQLMDFFEDHVRAVRWFTNPDNHAEAVKIIAEFMQQPAEGLQYLFTDADYYRDPYMVPNLDALQKGIDLSIKMGLAPNGIQIQPDHADLSFVEEAKRRIEADKA